jgi:hypothetical protein
MKRAQVVVAGILAAYEIVAIIWFVTGNAFPFPIGNFIGFFAVVGYIPGLILSLLVNQRQTTDRLTRRDRAVIVAEFIAIGASLIMLAIPVFVLENLVLWVVSAALAVAVFVRLRAR